MTEEELINGIHAENPGGMTICELHDALVKKGVDVDTYPKGTVIHMIKIEARRIRGTLALEDDDIAFTLAKAKRLLDKLK